MKLSFVIPAFNEERELPRTLGALHQAIAGSDQPDVEIIVVDDASTDTTAAIARAAGATVVPINRRQIAASRNAGARASSGEVLFFVDADTQINAAHIRGALVALENGYVGGSARVVTDGEIPRWGRVFIKIFSTLYFANGLGAGAFLFTTRYHFENAGAFDEQYFAGEEVYLSLALKKFGRLKILSEPITTSGRKLRMYSARYILSRFFGILLRGPKATRTRDRLDIWYNGDRETDAA